MAGAQPSTEDRMSEITAEADISRQDKIDANDPLRLHARSAFALLQRARPIGTLAYQVKTDRNFSLIFLSW